LNALCHRLATSLHAGIDLRACWAREAERAMGRQKHYFASIAQDIKMGHSLADAMARIDDYFPPLVRQLVEVGEASGTIERVFAGLSQHYGRILQMRRHYLSGVAWPAIQLVTALLVVALVILVTGIINKRTNQSVDMLGLGLVGVSGLIMYVIGVTSIASGLTLLCFAWSRGRMGGAILMRLLLHVPYLGECLRTFALARFAWTLSLTAETSMNVRTALRLALQSTGTSFYGNHGATIDRAIAQGCPIHEGLRAAGVFPREFVEILETGEISGKLSRALDFLAREYQQRAEAMSHVLTRLATMGTWLAVAAIMIFMIFRLASFYVGALQGAAGLN
jgi:type IV pilus assembly protein PilC